MGAFFSLFGFSSGPVEEYVYTGDDSDSKIGVLKIKGGAYRRTRRSRLHKKSRRTRKHRKQ